MHRRQRGTARYRAAGASWPLVVVLAACGLGGFETDGGDSEGSLAQREVFAAEDVRHLLVRTGFGVRSTDFDRASRDVPAFVDAMLQLPEPGTTAADIGAAAWLLNASDPPGLEGRFPSTTQLARWWTHILVHTEHPFQETMALFWHDHFAASSEVLSGSQRTWMQDHVNLFRRHGTGNFRDLVLAVARDGVMLEFLDGADSTKGEPNENFAREFWELFTLGVDNGYTEHDIKEAARAFTGYRSRFDATTGLSHIEFDADRHDVGAKVVLDSIIPNGTTGDDYAAMVDLTLRDRKVAEFVCTKLAAHFCFEDPPASLVAAMAEVLRGGNWELKPVLRRLFLSEAFYSPRARAGSVRSPLHFAIGFVRSTGLRPTINDLDAALAAMGHRPTQPPSVNGWPVHEEWLSAQGMVERANFVRRCIVSRSYQAGEGIDVAALLPSAQAGAVDVVDHLAWLLRVDLSAHEHATCVEYLNTDRRSDGSSRSSPFDPTDARHREERVRGLLYILAQHPSYMIR